MRIDPGGAGQHVRETAAPRCLPRGARWRGRWACVALAALAVLPGAAAVEPGCVPVRGERITVADVARALPAFAGSAGLVDVGLAPAPGMRRTLTRRDLEQLAAGAGVALPPVQAGACFERVAEPLTKEKVNAALAAALAGPGNKKFELIDYSRYRVPEGELEFPPPPRIPGAAPFIWRGQVRYGTGRSMPVWAKVRLDLPQPEIERGDRVAVEVKSGAAVLRFEAFADVPGRMGEAVTLRNPAGGARFTARVTGKGRAGIDASEDTSSTVRVSRGHRTGR